MNFNNFLLTQRSVDMRYKLEMIENKVKTFVQDADYSMDKKNGQRIVQAHGPAPQIRKGCEVFIGKIPRDMFEDEIIPIFERVGPIFKIRLMLDFSGINRGYGFITFYNQESANLAVTVLHGFEVRRGRHIGVYKSVDNCRLFVGGIPPERTKQEVHNALSEFVDGIEDVIMYQSHENKNLNRGFVFVEFEDHRSAAMARRKLSPGALILWEVPILVDWADPLPEVDVDIMAKVTKLYVRNLDLELTNDELFQTVAGFVQTDLIVKIHKILDYAFIHLVSRKAAEEALELLSGVTINGNKIEVTWARPRMYSKRNRGGSPPQHYCTSLPPRIRKQMQNIREQQSPRGSVSPPKSHSPVFNRASSSSCSLQSSMFCQGEGNGHNFSTLSPITFDHQARPSMYPMNRPFLNMPLQFN